MAKHTVLLMLCFLLLSATNLSCRSKHEQQCAPVRTLPADVSKKTNGLQETEPDPQEMLAAIRATQSHSHLLRKIEEAKQLLRPAPLRTSKIGGDNAVLALWNPATGGDIRLVTMVDGTCKDFACTITVVRANGVNSQYQVDLPLGSMVIALKTNVKDPRRKGVAVPVVYVPYSRAIQTPETVRAGKEYLLSLVRRGTERIDTYDVRSQLDAAKRPTDTVPASILATLLVVEHVNPDDFDRDGIGPEAGKVLTVLATNREDAYRYAVSYAHARGLAQFIQSTYDLTRKRYPRARLPEDFVNGMTDHENAVCAQFCLADWSLTRLPDKQLQKLLPPQNKEDLGAFLAAGYNGGEDKAARAVIASPQWEKAGNGLFPQTVKYVEIFRATYRYLYP